MCLNEEFIRKIFRFIQKERRFEKLKGEKNEIKYEDEISFNINEFYIKVSYCSKKLIEVYVTNHNGFYENLTLGNKGSNEDLTKEIVKAIDRLLSYSYLLR